MDNILNILVQMVAGGFTGYITNTFAIDMLFKEYILFNNIKIGGVIKKTKNDFIENVSSMIERDIINYNTLGKELHKADFEASVEKLVHDFLKTALYEYLEEKSFQELDEADETLKETKKFFDNILKDHTSQVVGLVFRNLEIENLFSKEQVIYLTNDILEKSIEFFEKKDFFEGFLNTFLKEKGELSLEDYFGVSGIKIKEQTLRELEEGLLSLQQNDRNEIRNFLDSMVYGLDYEKIIGAFQDELYKKTLSQVIAPANREAVFEVFKENMILFINSVEGSEILVRLLKEVVQRLKKIDKSLFDLISSEFQPAVEEYLEKNIPVVIEKLVSWIQKNAGQIEKMIQEAIDETIEGTEGMRGFVLGIIKGVILDDIAAQNRLVGKIVEYLEEKTDIKQLSKALSEEAIAFFKKKKIKDVIVELEDKGIISYSNLGTLLVQAISKYLKQLDTSSSEKFFDKKIEDILKIDLTVVFNEKLKGKFINSLVNYLCETEILREKIKTIFASYYDKVLKMPLRELISPEIISSWSSSLTQKGAAKLRINKSEMALYFTNSLFEKNMKNTVDELMDLKQRENISKEIYEIANKKINFLIEENRQKPMGLYLDNINELPDIQGALSGKLLSFLQDNLPDLLEGKIEMMVNDNLSKLSEDEVCDLLHDFMGRELQPITRFGAFLGGAAGIFLALTTGGSSFAALELNLSSLITYGLVGVITNVIALEMIFRPYEKSKFLSAVGLEAFSQGYILKNKDIFAENMGKFVDESLLERGKIKARFAENREELGAEMQRLAALNQYELIEKFIEKYAIEISDFAYSSLGNFLKENNEKNAESLINGIKEIRFSKVFEEKQIAAIGRLLIDGLGAQKGKISGVLLSAISSEKPLLGGLDYKVRNLVKKNIESEFNNQTDYLINNISDKEAVYKEILRKRDTYARFMEKSLDDYLSEESFTRINDYLISKIKSELSSQSNHEKAYAIINNKLNQRMDPDIEIGDLFGGRFRSYAENNLDNILEKTKFFLVEALKKNEDKIKNEVKKKIHENMGIFQKGAYMLVSGDLIVEEIITRLLNKKVPKYFDSSKEEIQTIIISLLEENIYKAKLNDLQLRLKENQSQIILEDFLSSKDNLNIIASETGEIVKGLFEALAKVPLGYYLRIVELNYLGGLLERFDSELTATMKSLTAVLESEKEGLAAQGAVLSMDLLEIIIKDVKIRDIFSEISDEDVENLIDKIIKDFQQENSIRIFLEDIIYNIYLEKFYESTLIEILDIEIMKSDLQKSVEKLLTSQDFGEVVSKIILDIVFKLKESRFDFVQENTKDEIFKIFISAALEVIENNLPDLLKVIDFKTITEEEISKMDAREVHELFKSFAGKYFTQLKLWGLLGAGFGIHGGISLIATLGYFFTGRNSDK